MDNKVIDVDYTEVDTREYFTLEEASEKIGTDIEKIIFWCNKFDDILKINSIGQYKIFSKEDIRNLKTIKELNIDKNMSINEIKQYLNQHSTSIVVRKDDEFSKSIFNFFSNIVNNQNQKIDKLIEAQNQSLKMFSKLYNEISVDAEEKNKILNTILEQQKQSKIEISDKIKTYVEDVGSAVSRNNEERDVKIINMLNKQMEEKRLMAKIEQEKNKSKGLFSRLFKK
jgi:DNA-binding transcriptional MerR regulator